MKKVTSILSLFILINFSVNAQEETKDFKINSYSIIVNHVTPEAIEAINNTEGKENINVVIGKVANQSDFDLVCENFTWIGELEIARNNEHINNITAISNLKSLTKFKINSLKTSKEIPINLQPLLKLTLLTDLDFYATHVTNTEALSNLDQLRNVSLYMSTVNSISFLEKMPNIRQLSLYDFTLNH